MNVPDNGAAQLDCRRCVFQRVLHQYDVGRFNGNIRSCANSDSDIRARQSRGVVNPVSYHGNLMPLLLKRTDLSFFFRGQHVGNSFFNAKLFPDRFSGNPVVSRQHDDMKAHFRKPADRRPTRFPNRICHCDNTDQRAVAGKKQRRFSLFCQAPDLRFGLPRGSAALKESVFFHKRRISRKIRKAAHDGPYAAACQCLEAFRLRNTKPVLPRAFRYRLGKGMLASAFGGGRFLQKRLLSQRGIQQYDICHRRTAGSNRSRFIENDRIHIVQIFQAFC